MADQTRHAVNYDSLRIIGPFPFVSEIELGVWNNMQSLSYHFALRIPDRPNHQRPRSQRTPDRRTYTFITSTAHYTSQ